MRTKVTNVNKSYKKLFYYNWEEIAHELSKVAALKNAIFNVITGRHLLWDFLSCHIIVLFQTSVLKEFEVWFQCKIQTCNLFIVSSNSQIALLHVTKLFTKIKSNKYLIHEYDRHFINNLIWISNEAILCKQPRQPRLYNW